MERGAWWATVHGVARVGHHLATKPPPPLALSKVLLAHLLHCLGALNFMIIDTEPSGDYLHLRSWMNVATRDRGSPGH